MSANINAPASMVNSPVSGSLVTAAVNPAPDAVLPQDYTLSGKNLLTHFKKLDLDVPGSPTRHKFMSPLKEEPLATL